MASIAIKPGHGRRRPAGSGHRRPAMDRLPSSAGRSVPTERSAGGWQAEMAQTGLVRRDPGAVPAARSASSAGSWPRGSAPQRLAPAVLLSGCCRSAMSAFQPATRRLPLSVPGFPQFIQPTLPVFFVGAVQGELVTVMRLTLVRLHLDRGGGVRGGPGETGVGRTSVSAQPVKSLRRQRFALQQPRGVAQGRRWQSCMNRRRRGAARPISFMPAPAHGPADRVGGAEQADEEVGGHALRRRCRSAASGRSGRARPPPPQSSPSPARVGDHLGQGGRVLQAHIQPLAGDGVDAVGGVADQGGARLGDDRLDHGAGPADRRSAAPTSRHLAQGVAEAAGAGEPRRPQTERADQRLGLGPAFSLHTRLARSPVSGRMARGRAAHEVLVRARRCADALGWTVATTPPWA